MKKILEIVFRYIFTLSALSLMIMSRSRIGADNFLPWGVQLKHPVVRIFIRLFTVPLLFIWIRLFFMLEYLSAPSVVPFDTNMSFYEQLTEYRPYPISGSSALQLLYYLSLAAPIVALAHLIAIEVYYMRKVPISSSSLGKCGVLDNLEGKRLFKLTVDKYVIWTIEALWIFCVGIIIKLTLASTGLSSLLLAGGISMLLQTQILRLKNRDTIQRVVDGSGMYDGIHPATQKLKSAAKASRKGQPEDEHIAGIA